MKKTKKTTLGIFQNLRFFNFQDLDEKFVLAKIFEDRGLIFWNQAHYMVKAHEDDIGLIIYHFLVSAVSITESPKNKIMGKTGFYGSSACQGSAVE